MTLLLWTAWSVLLGFRGPDTTGEEYGENQTKINNYTIFNPLPNWKAYCSQFVLAIPLRVQLFACPLSQVFYKTQII